MRQRGIEPNTAELLDAAIERTNKAALVLTIWNARAPEGMRSVTKQKVVEINARRIDLLQLKENAEGYPYAAEYVAPKHITTLSLIAKEINDYFTKKRVCKALHISGGQFDEYERMFGGDEPFYTKDVKKASL